MFSKKMLFAILISVLTVAAINAIESNAPVCGNNITNCKDLSNPCRCYCSKKCGPRDKKPDDRPVFVENDPAGNFCYCKQWDLDEYYIRGCNIPDQEKQGE